MATIGYVTLLLLLFYKFCCGAFLEEKGHGPCGSHGEQSAIVPGQVNSSSYARTAFRGLYTEMTIYAALPFVLFQM